MKEKSVFSFNTYKGIMAHHLSGATHRGELTRAAKVLACQRSYLSRVISDSLHLTPDHAFNLANFLKFNLSEREYFLTLVEIERAGDRNYRDFLKTKLEELKKKNESIAERTERKSLVFETHHASYFSSWTWSAIHFLTSIPKYQSVEAISERLGLSHKSTLDNLRWLELQGYIFHEQDKWKYLAGEFHAPNDSPLVIMHHQNWRMRAMMDAQNLGQGESVHYTGVQTMSVEDAQKIKELLLNFLGDASRIASPSKPEECLALTCDLFKA